MSNIAWKIFKASLHTPIRTWGQITARHYDVQNTVVITCSPRGGSTWVAEILQTIPGYLMLWEPFHQRINPESNRHGFNWGTYMPQDAVDEQKSEYIYHLLTGRALSPRIISRKQFKFEQILRFEGYIAKILHGQRFLRWMLDLYPVPTIFVLRHPCAVVASQLRHKAWDGIGGKRKSLPADLQRDYPHLIPINERIKSREESLALTWAIDTHIPLNTPKPHPWHLVTYESLVTNGEEAIDHIFQYLGKPVPLQAYHQLRIPSATTEDNSPFSQGHSALSGWKKALSSEQIDNILRVVHEVGLDFYTDELQPDYKKLNITL